MQRAEQVGLHHRRQVVGVCVVDRLPVARVVAVLHQDVDVAEALDRRLRPARGRSRGRSGRCDWAIDLMAGGAISAATVSSMPVLRAPIASFAPCSANWIAISRPRPGPMPVMTATFPGGKSCIISLAMFFLAGTV